MRRERGLRSGVFGSSAGVARRKADGCDQSIARSSCATTLRRTHYTTYTCTSKTYIIQHTTRLDPVDYAATAPTRRYAATLQCVAPDAPKPRPSHWNRLPMARSRATAPSTPTRRCKPPRLTSPQHAAESLSAGLGALDLLEDARVIQLVRAELFAVQAEHELDERHARRMPHA